MKGLLCVLLMLAAPGVERPFVPVNSSVVTVHKEFVYAAARVEVLLFEGGEFHQLVLEGEALEDLRAFLDGTLRDVVSVDNPDSNRAVISALQMRFLLKGGDGDLKEFLSFGVRDFLFTEEGGYNELLRLLSRYDERYLKYVRM